TVVNTPLTSSKISNALPERSMPRLRFRWRNTRAARVSFSGLGRLLDVGPVAPLDGGANVSRALSLFVHFVRKECFFLADIAVFAVRINVAIVQTSMPAATAPAIARLLREHHGNLFRDLIGPHSLRIGKIGRRLRGRQRLFGLGLAEIRRHRRFLAALAGKERRRERAGKN